MITFHEPDWVRFTIIRWSIPVLSPLFVSYSPTGHCHSLCLSTPLSSPVSFLYFLQVARVIANYTLGAGLLGEIALGIIYGPLANLLQDDWDSTFLILGYLGLILIVFEGYFICLLPFVVS